MSLRKSLLKINNRLESKWQLVKIDQEVTEVDAGWYVAEFQLEGVQTNLPRLIIEREHKGQIERELIGAHSGRNRMLFYLPKGQITAISKGLSFERFARLGKIEARFRIALICMRYLRDFPRPGVLLKMLAIQFQAPFELSSQVLEFYEPARGGRTYLAELEKWHKKQRFKRFYQWQTQSVKIAVIIENEAQAHLVNDALVPADWIILAGEPLPKQADYVIALKASDQLRFAALYLIKRAIQKARVRPRLIYTDHDYRLDENTSLPPVFKPCPSHAYLHCVNYIGFAQIMAASFCNQVNSRELIEDECKYRLAMQAFNSPSEVLSISEALFTCSRQVDPKTPVSTSAASIWPNIQWLRDQQINRLQAAEGWQAQAGVELIIPTRDGLSVLKPCVESILEKTEYPHYELTIVDNGSEKAATLAFFEELNQNDRVKVLSYPGEFNYSAINNFAVQQSKADYIALVNNDIEVIDGDWLHQMMVWAGQDNVGAVGAKLLFSNNKVQHAGVIIGMGNAAGHIHRLEDRDAAGYQYRCQATQNMMAVTAACLVTPRALFNQLGGLNETDFKVAYNDIDYCLRVEALGKEIIWTPEALLYHHESVSRGDDMSDQHIERYFRELERFQQRWKSKGFVDKYYSKHLRITDEGVFPHVESNNNRDLIYLAHR